MPRSWNSEEPPRPFAAKTLQIARGFSSEELGAWFEDQVQNVLAWMLANTRFVYHRLPDSKSAGSLIARQPADFMIGSKHSGFALLEVKASGKHTSLRGCLSSNLSKGQAALISLWDRADQKTLVLFLSVHPIFGQYGLLELWHGGHVSEQRKKGKPLDPAVGLIAAAKGDELVSFLSYYLNLHNYSIGD